MEVDPEHGQIQCEFQTALPTEFQVEAIQIDISTSATTKQLSLILKQLLADTGRLPQEQIDKSKFNFMVDNVFLTSTLLK